MYRLGLYEKAMPATLSMKEQLEAAKKSGFDYVELSIDESDEKLARLDWSDAQISALVQQCEDAGISFGSICLSGHRRYPLGEKGEESLRIMAKAIRLARGLGIPLIQLAGYDTYYHAGTAETRARFLENLGIATQMAATEGVLLGFETMETSFMDTVGKAMAYVHALGSPYLGIYPDVGNLSNAALVYDTSVVADLEKGRGHLFATHIKETVPGKYRCVPFGAGDVDFPVVLKSAWDLGVRRFVMECWYDGSDDWQKGLDRVNLFARSILDSFANRK